MRFDEFAAPNGAGASPTFTGATFPTIPALTVVVMTWTAGIQKLLIDIPSFAGTCYIALDAATVGATSADAITLNSDNPRIEVGKDRPHLINKVAIYSDTQLILSGAGKNATIVGWPAR